MNDYLAQQAFDNQRAAQSAQYAAAPAPRADWAPLTLNLDAVESTISRMEQMADALETKLIGHQIHAVGQGMLGSSGNAAPIQPSFRERFGNVSARLNVLENTLTRLTDAV